MGNVTRRVTNYLIRPVKEYNLYERAHKSVLKNKYVPSPKHPSTQEFIDKTINELSSDVKEKLTNPDVSLEERLRQVYVTSQDIGPVQTQSIHPDRTLPLDRGHHEVPEYGFHEPKVVPYGKVTLKAALGFISSHQTDPSTNSANSIALKHKLDQRLTEQVLKHFGTFRLYMPSQPTDKQLELLEQLQATPTTIPNTADLKHRLQGIAMSHKTDDTSDVLPLQKFPDPAPEPFESTLMYPLDPNAKSSEGIKDLGTAQYIADDAKAEDSRQTSNDVATTKKADEPLPKNKNADAT